MPSESSAPLTVTLYVLPFSSARLADATSNPDGIAPPGILTFAAAATAKLTPEPTVAPVLPVETLGLLGNVTDGSVAPPKGKLEVATVLEPDDLDELGIVGMFGKNGMLL